MLGVSGVRPTPAIITIQLVPAFSLMYLTLSPFFRNCDDGPHEPNARSAVSDRNGIGPPVHSGSLRLGAPRRLPLVVGEPEFHLSCELA
jgi:hypothetical protein